MRSLADVLGEVRKETGLDLATAKLRMGFARGHLLEVVVRHSEFGSSDDERALDAANALVRGLLGDDAFDTWIGAVDVAPAPRGGSLRVLPEGAPAETLLRPEELVPAFEAAVRSVDATLPAVPYPFAAESRAWTLLEASPEPAQDYAAQDDVALFSTSIPEAMKSFLQGAPFASRRFSRHGEVFAYLKCDAASDSAEARHARRVALEECLDAALRAAGLGGVVGAGLGVRYVYVALSLVRPKEAMDAAVASLRNHGVPRRSWILFYDADRSGEYVSVWDGVDAPPR